MSIELKDYDFPEALKDMTPNEMEILGYAIREFLIDNVSKTGGHLAPNLGVVELTLAVHKVFDAPCDKIIWDVGHQSYVHKILTGRIDGFKSLRQFGGMSGFPKRQESKYDTFDTGHSSTSISIAHGIATARDLKKDKYQVVAIIGDGAMTSGAAFEGLNNLADSNKHVIIILNDNGMSISPNVGGLSKHLTGLRGSDRYLKAKKTLRKVDRIPGIGETIYHNLKSVRDYMKYAMLPKGVFFEELGFKYLGPIDGHNIENLLEAFSVAKKIEGPVIIHTITKKGKGYISAESYPDKFHGIGPFNPCTGLTESSIAKDYSAVFGDELLNLRKDDDRICAITAAMCSATGLSKFAAEYPEHFFDVGIAEGHGVTFSAGLAISGLRPVVAIYSTFLQRAYDQIIEDVCLQNLNITFAIDRAGVVGADGETHHGVFDISYLSHMPNMTIMTPHGEIQLRMAIRAAMNIDGPVAIRYPRGSCIETGVPEIDHPVNYANTRIIRGDDVDIWAAGKMIHTAIEAAEILKKWGVDAGIVDVMIAKPIDLQLLNKNSNMLVTIEDGVVSGGIGEKLAAMVNDSMSVMNIGWPDKFVEHGDYYSLARKYGMDAKSIAERVYEKIKETSRHTAGRKKAF